MTDGMTEAYRVQRRANREREEHRLAIRRWMAHQLNQWSQSSYLTVQESDHAKELAASIQGEVEVRPKRSKTTGTGTSKNRTTTKPPKGA